MFALEDLRVARDGREILRLDRLALGAEGVTAILGHNGSGKSTLMALLARQMRPETGRITLEGRPLDRYRQKALARRVSFLPQRLPPVAGLSVRDLAGLGRFAWRGALGRMAALDGMGLRHAAPGKASDWGFVQKRVEDLARYEQAIILHIGPFAERDTLAARPIWQFMPFIRAGRYAETRTVWTFGGVFSLGHLAEAFADALLTLDARVAR